MKKILFLMTIALCLALAGPAQADPPAHAKGHGGGKKEKSEKPGKGPKYSGKQGKHGGPDGKYRGPDGDDLIRATITAIAAREIAVRGGWVGYQPLPPGIAKNLARGKPLPPGIAKKTLPPGMMLHLPVYRGYSWYAAGRDLILVSLAGMVIADILHDVFD